MGNIYGRLPGSDPAAAAVATGSHTDAIPGAGAYDGTVGVCSTAGPAAVGLEFCWAQNVSGSGRC